MKPRSAQPTRPVAPPAPIAFGAPPVNAPGQWQPPTPQMNAPGQRQPPAQPGQWQPPATQGASAVPWPTATPGAAPWPNAAQAGTQAGWAGAQAPYPQPAAYPDPRLQPGIGQAPGQFPQPTLPGRPPMAQGPAGWPGGSPAGQGAYAPGARGKKALPQRDPIADTGSQSPLTGYSSNETFAEKERLLSSEQSIDNSGIGTAAMEITAPPLVKILSDRNSLLSAVVIHEILGAPHSRRGSLLRRERPAQQNHEMEVS
jgi:hypothetical protein